VKQNVVLEELAGVERAWAETLARIDGQVPEHMFSSMISALKPLSLEEGNFTLGAPNAFAKDIISSKYIDVLSGAATGAIGRPISIVLTISSPSEMVESVAERATGREEMQGASRRLMPEEALPKKYTFDNFVVGDSNKFAYHAALMVAEIPGDKYNPLFI
jgi:chromosomal replication initiator protein